MSDEINLLDGKESESKGEYEVLLTELRKRCESAKLKLEERAFEFDDEDNSKSVSIYIPNGRDTRQLTLYSNSRIRDLLAIEFEKYVYLGDLVAICSYSAGTIEAAVRNIAPGPSSQLLRILQGLGPSYPRPDEGDEEERPVQPIELASPVGNSHQRIVLGPPTKAMEVLGRTAFISRPTGVAISLLGFEPQNHDQSLSLLRRIATSVFFGIDLDRGITLGLMPNRRRPTVSWSRRRSRIQNKSLQFPSTEYDEAPMALYWYARSAVGMPLLQYLAYYQATEFYFPISSQAEARRRVRNILKNPLFRADKDSDIAKILAAASGAIPQFGDERSQLRATINECIEPDTLRAFLTANEERSDHFSIGNKGLTDHTIPIKNKTVDLRNDVADRIYDIRCRIVHTKSGLRDREVELLLPFSKEAESLYPDIDLIEYIARQVLVANSASLTSW